MRVIRALRTLIKHYRKIVPVYVISVALLALASHVLPPLGTIFVLPLSVGVAYAMLHAITKGTKLKIHPLSEGFKRSYYFDNIIFLLLRQLLYLTPLLIGVVLSGLLSGVVFEIIPFDIPSSVVVLNFLAFVLPSALVSLMLAMVPYLLADRQFDQRKHNPLKASVRIMKGNYLKLLAIRLFFIPWLLWFSSGFVLTAVSMYSRIFSGETLFPGLTISWLVSVPLIFLLINPWYHMAHAELYVNIRDKLNEIKR